MSAGGGDTPSGQGLFGSSGISGFGYGVGVSIGILLLVSTIALTIYFCTRTSMPVTAAFLIAPPAAPPRDVEQQGIDEATLAAFPALPYAEARKRRGGLEVEEEQDEDDPAASARQQHAGTTATSSGCCPVCLDAYDDRDVVRVLPDCGHLFHRACVDPWLRLRPTCPVCRTSPLPSPMPTPLAEVTPLAAARRN